MIVTLDGRPYELHRVPIEQMPDWHVRHPDLECAGTALDPVDGWPILIFEPRPDPDSAIADTQSHGRQPARSRPELQTPLSKARKGRVGLLLQAEGPRGSTPQPASDTEGK